MSSKDGPAPHDNCAQCGEKLDYDDSPICDDCANEAEGWDEDEDEEAEA